MAKGEPFGRCLHEDGCSCMQFVPTRCERTLRPGQKKCHQHGGKTPAGPLSVHWRGKGYSTVLPKKLVAHFNEALHDPDRLSLQQEVATLRATISDLWSRIGEQSHAPKAALVAGATVGRAWRQFQSAYRSQHAERLQQALTGLDEAVRALSAAISPAKVESDLRGEVRATMLVVERLTRSENTRLVEMHNMISAEKALALTNAFVLQGMEVFDALVEDKALRLQWRREVSGRMQALVGSRQETLEAEAVAVGDVDEPDDDGDE